MRYLIPILTLLVFMCGMTVGRFSKLDDADYYKGLSEQRHIAIKKYHAKLIFTTLQRDCMLHALKCAINDDEPMGD